MYDYNKNSFFSCVDKLTGIRKYYMKIKNQLIEVDKSVYLICHSSYEKQLRDIRRDIKNGLLSYDMQINDELTLLDSISNSVDETELISNYKFTLNEIIENLNEPDKYIIMCLYYYGKSERDIALELGISQQAVNKRKKRILNEIKNKF